MKFHMGVPVMTAGACQVLDQLLALSILARHASGDWGEVGKEDWAANDAALVSGERLLSAYTVDGTKIWVITEADRSSTTILLPDEY